MSKITEFLPCVVESIVQTQYTLLSNAYSAVYEYGNEFNFTDPDGEVVIAEWEDLFTPVQQQVESEISFIARGKAITMPMSQLAQEKSYMPSIPRIGRGKKPPPPPPPANAPAAATPDEKSRLGKMMPSRFSREKEEPAPSPPTSRSSKPSIGSTKNFSSNREREESPPRLSSRPTIGGAKRSSGGRDGGISPPPPVSRARTTIGGIKSRASNSNLSVSRDESPPPPLPGPRPGQPGSRQSSTGEVQQHDFRSVIKSRSATPLAGIAQNSLAPSQRSDLVRIRSAGSSDSRQPEERFLGAVSPSAIRAAERSLSMGASDYQNSRPAVSRSPTAASVSSYKTTVSDTGSLSSIAGKKKPPPPPPPKKKALGKGETWVRALFPFGGQDDGDLVFKEGDKIKVLKKTESTDGMACFILKFSDLRTWLISCQ